MITPFNETRAAALLELLAFLVVVLALLVVRACHALFDDARLAILRAALEARVRVYAYGPAPVQAPPVPRRPPELTSVLLARGEGTAHVDVTEAQT
ncbi:MAG: hypothetical protein J0L92_32715 [Deltaproteobacteria bacterium]|nr:hypothetical protein [Deltaproteobacteria bacterium]